MNTLRLAIAQLNFLVGDIEGNATRIIQETKKISDEKAVDLVIFPEFSLCGYPPEDLLFRSEFHSRCRKSLSTIQSEVTDTAIIIGYPQQKNEGCYNSACLIQHGECITTYNKQMLPNYTVFDEKRYFIPGKTSCVFEMKEVRIGLLICEDIWYPEPIKRTADLGAQLIICINASPYHKNKITTRANMLKQRAQEIQLPIIYVNLVGGQDELVFDGGSTVVDSNGNCCQQAPFYEEAVMLTDINIHSNKTISITPQSVPNQLSSHENIYKALTLAVRDYIHKNNFKGALIGLSGGVDSALTLAIACDAIGHDHVIAVLMPSRYTAPMSIEDALSQTKALQVKHYLISIEEIFTVFLNTLSPIFKDLKTDITEENLQARIRGTLLMALSNKFGHLVLTTGNKSELSVGYTTLYGDMVGGFAPLKDVSKTLVYELAQYRNSIHPIIPERVLTRAPSAELASNQTDQDTLPPYNLLDDILFRYIEQEQSLQELYEEEFDKNTVNRVVKMINNSEYKRRQSPVGTRLSKCAFGKDRRYPITSGFLKNLSEDPT